MTLAEQKAVVAHTSEAFSDTESNVVTEAAKAVLKDSEARGGGVQMLGVDKIYPGSTVKALDDFNLEINPGEMVVLLGGSGCGKSTALRSLAGLEDIQAGRILVGGQDVTGVPVNKRDMAMVFQAYSLFPHMTALQNVEFGLEIRGVDRAERRRQAMEKLELVGLADQAKKYTQQMSGGQQQRVGIARALVVGPQIIFADEPTGNLDSKTTMEVLKLMQKIVREQKQTLVMVTHDNNLATYADRIFKIIDGQIVHIEENHREVDLEELERERFGDYNGSGPSENRDGDMAGEEGQAAKDGSAPEKDAGHAPAGEETEEKTEGGEEKK